MQYYVVANVRECFSCAEADALMEYFRTWPVTELHKYMVWDGGHAPADEVGYGAIPSGGDTENYMFTKSIPSPPVPVYGFFRKQIKRMLDLGADGVEFVYTRSKGPSDVLFRERAGGPPRRSGPMRGPESGVD